MPFHYCTEWVGHRMSNPFGVIFAPGERSKTDDKIIDLAVRSASIGPTGARQQNLRG